MPRKYDRYGFNRQFRRNPSRKRNPFPYRLPFMPDYRINPRDDPDYDVSAATSSRYRKVIDEMLSKHGQFHLKSKRPRDLNYTNASKRQRVLTWAALAAQIPQNSFLVYTWNVVKQNPEFWFAP